MSRAPKIDLFFWRAEKITVSEQQERAPAVNIFESLYPLSSLGPFSRAIPNREVIGCEAASTIEFYRRLDLVYVHVQHSTAVAGTLSVIGAVDKGG